MPTIHEPVLLKEVIELLDPKPGDNFIDCTFGGGGHSLALLEAVKPDGKVIGFDWDKAVIADSSNGNLILVNDSYVNLKKHLEEIRQKLGEIKIKGVLLDLGLSSDQLDNEERGFGFESAGPLDMRFDTAADIPTAADLLEKSSAKELARIFTDYGDEPLAQIIARAIVKQRDAGEDVRSAEMLVRLIADIYRRKFREPSRRNPATRVMQALRIAVNDEFGNIRRVLPQAVDVLKSGGRVAVISFHSGEDRIVKNFFRDMSTEGTRLKVITKKPVVGTPEEIRNNPRSRSAKLRVAEKI